jgi:hypothetical protein
MASGLELIGGIKRVGLGRNVVEVTLHVRAQPGQAAALGQLLGTTQLIAVDVQTL